MLLSYVSHSLLPQLHAFQLENQATWQGVDPNKTTMNEVYTKFGLDENTADFTGTLIECVRANIVFDVIVLASVSMFINQLA